MRGACRLTRGARDEDTIAEFSRLAGLVAGREPARSVEIYVWTSREVAALAEVDAKFQSLRDFRVNIVVDTCTYLAPVVRATHGVIVTNSGKFAHYGPGNLKRRILGRVDPILVIGSLVAADLYDIEVPIVIVDEVDWHMLATARRAVIDGRENLLQLS